MMSIYCHSHVVNRTSSGSPWSAIDFGMLPYISVFKVPAKTDIWSVDSAL